MNGKARQDMLAAADKDNMDHVRSALQGITGVDPAKPPPQEWWYGLLVRGNHEMETVDSLRRHGRRSCWPSYEKLVPTRRSFEGRPIRRLVRCGIVPYVFTPAEEGVVDLLEQIVGVFDVIRTDSGRPMFLRALDIDIIRKIAIGENASTEKSMLHDFKEGEKVRFVHDGTSQWPPGKITKLARDGRITVDVNLMGRVVPITVLPFQIKRT